ncbi:MAG: polysaccharide biosynthesis protein [Bacteroidales bacterium]|nr:polysaccharide biosynthesis protein [Bacteroidales bacterium]
MLKTFFYNLVKRYRHSTVPRWIMFTIDIVLFAGAFTVAELFSWRLEGHMTWNSVWINLAICLTVTLAFFYLFKTYRSIIRHMGLNDIFRILMAGVFMAVTCGVMNFANNRLLIVPTKTNIIPSYGLVIMLYSMLALLMLLTRFMILYIYNQYFKRRRRDVSVVIYGAGAAGVIANNALKQDIHVEYKVVAFIDDDKSKVNQQLDSVPVMRARDVLNPKFIESKNISQLIIAIPTLRLMHKQAITNRALDLGLTVKAVPHISTWMNGTFTANQIQDIKIEDLLQREPIKIDNINVVREVLDKTVLVTGAAGSIGSEICRQLLQYKPKQIVMLDQAESPLYDLQFELRNNEPYKKYVDSMAFVIANVKDYSRMEEVFEQYRPNLVYHAAAYKHVPFMEENPYEAVFVNVFGSKNVADLAIKYGTEKFVMVSTDKAVNPTNVMGATKRMAEIYIQSRSTDTTHFVTTRFGNVLGSNGSVIPLFKKQLASGGPLTVTHKDIIRYFMTIPEACNLVLEAGAMGEGGDIFVFDMGKPVKIYDLAKRMIQLSGLKGIEIKEIGLRPGEKLYEELLATKENNIPTYHPKILRAEVRKYKLEDIDREYGELQDILYTLDDRQIVAKMKSIVPEFISNNSVYCDLDKKEDNQK